MWPLYSNVVAGRASKKMTAYIVSVLRRIGTEMGVKHAAALADVLQGGKTEVIWDESESAKVRDGWSVETCGFHLKGMERIGMLGGDNDDDCWEVCTRTLIRLEDSKDEGEDGDCE